MLALAASGAARAQDKPVELRFAHWLPARVRWPRPASSPGPKAVEAASGGSIKVTMYPAQQLGKTPDHSTWRATSIADMTWVNAGLPGDRSPPASCRS